MSSDTLGSIARNIGAENFKCMAGECMELGMVCINFTSYIIRSFDSERILSIRPLGFV